MEKKYEMNAYVRKISCLFLIHIQCDMNIDILPVYLRICGRIHDFSVRIRPNPL